MGDKELSILLKTKDQSSAEFKKVDKAARELGQQMKAHGVKGGAGLETIKKEMVKLEAEAKKLGVNGTKNLSSLQNQIQKMEAPVKASGMSISDAYTKAGIAIAAVTAAAYAMYSALDKTVLAVARDADEMGDLADKTGLSAEFLQVLRHQAKYADVDFGQLTQGVKKFNKFTGEAAMGNKAAAKTFHDMGIKIRDTSGKVRDSKDIYLEFIDKLKKIPDIQTRNALAAKAFGKSAADLDPILKQGSSGFQAWAADMMAAGIYMGDDLIAEGARYDEMQKRLGDATKAGSVTLAKYFLPIINDAGEALTRFLTDHQTEVDTFSSYWSNAWKNFWTDHKEDAATAGNFWGTQFPQYLQDGTDAFYNFTKDWSGDWDVLLTDAADGIYAITSAVQNGFNSLSAWFSSGSVGIAIYEYFEKMKSDSLYIVGAMWDGITGWFSRSYDTVTGWVGRLVDSVLAKFRLMKNEAVTNSIIPDMVVDIEGWFDRLATTAPASAADMASAVNDEFSKIAAPEELAKPERPGNKKKKSKEDLDYEAADAAYDARQKEIKAVKSYNDMMEELYMDGLSDYDRKIYEEEKRYREEREAMDRHLADMSAAQREEAKRNGTAEKMQKDHEKRMKKIEDDAARAKKQADRDKVAAMRDSAKAFKESQEAERDAAKENITAIADLFGVGLKEQAAIMVPWEVAEAASDFADFLGGNPVALAASLAHAAAAKSWIEAAQGVGGGGGSSGGGGGGGGGKNKGKHGRGDDLPGRNSEARRDEGWGDITIDTGKLSGKMIMGDAGDISNFFLGQLNQKYRQHAKINWVSHGVS
jgi:hypothetical protein